MITRIISRLYTAVLGFIIFAGVSCSSQDPSFTNIESYNFYHWGDNQTGIAGQYLRDSIVVGYTGSILNKDSDNYSIPKGVRVHFEVISGNGTIEKPDQEIPVSGFASTKWKTGTSTTDQHVTATVYSATGKLLTRINFTAYAFQPGRWDVISYLTNGSLRDMVRDTIHHRTFMIVGDKLYTEGDEYFQWNIVKNFEDHSCHSIEIDNNGIIYIGCWDGKLYKTNDLASTFTECAKPIPEYAGYFELILTNDNKIWVTRWNYPLRFSNDGGQTWKITESGLKSSSQSLDVVRYSTGDYVTMSNDMKTMSKSSDGIHWLPINNIPIYTSKIFITDTDELIAINQESGISIYKSVNEGQTFNRLYSISIPYGAWPMTGTFSKINGYYYVCIPGAGILKTTNFDTFEFIYSNAYIRGLMIDHSGVFFATASDFKTVYCYK